MNRERWEQLKPLFYGALEKPSSQRADWLRDACADDTLRAEAAALLEAHDTAGGFLESPATFDASDDDVSGSTRLEPGRLLGPYRVQAEIGRGGMGIVYLAEDVRLGRTVALKALPASLADDPRRRERLRREARAAAALTHPGIAIVYALEEIDGDVFIASEYVRGRTLRSELNEGPFGPERALDTTIELVRALCAAHEAGIVHRDLKPENILRNADSALKVLDFGIAQFTDRTLTQLTIGGSVLGTPAYMAPEQLAGGDVDFRADIYAVGVLLLEMITGVHPFASGSFARHTVPEPLKRIADRCLARDPQERYASTRELLTALEEARSAITAADGSAGFPKPRGENLAAAPLTPRWWWEFHQAVAALVYGLMALPAWSARQLIGGTEGRAIFIAILVAVILSASLRLHRWFTSRFYPSELEWVRNRTAAWITVADWAFAAALAIAGLLVGDTRSPLAILLLSVGVGAAVVFQFVEPVTERAAFRK